MIPILIVDDDTDFSRAVGKLLGRAGYEARPAASLAEARKALSDFSPAVTFVDLMLPDGNGLDLVEERAARLGRVVVITGNASLEAALRSIQSGVDDFLVKPLEFDDVRACLERLVPGGVGMAVDGQDLDAMLIGQSRAMRRVKEAIRKVASTDVTVFIHGETGTGKEIVARALHALSARAQGPFEALNCGAVAKELLASELFGHERGSFTGASRQHKGHFERAAGGTLFLDEITEMSAELQVHLLRVLEEGRFRRVGGERELEADARVLVASNRVPSEAVAEGHFREDLYYRLNVLSIELPPLRERTEDVAALAAHFLAELNRRYEEDKRFATETLQTLRKYAWPGNVRELKNALQRGYLLADGAIEAKHVLAEHAALGEEGEADDELEPLVGMPLRDVERRLIEAALRKFEGDKPLTAKALGISLKTLYNRLNEYARAGAPGDAAARESP